MKPIVFNGGEITMFINKYSRIVVTRNVKKSTYVDSNGKRATWEEVQIVDGIHNNAGWTIRDPYDEVVAKIAAAMQD